MAEVFTLHIPVVVGTRCLRSTKTGDQCNNKVMRSSGYAGPYCVVHSTCQKGKCKMRESGGTGMCSFHGGTKDYNRTACHYDLNRVIRVTDVKLDKTKFVEQRVEDFVRAMYNLLFSDGSETLQMKKFPDHFRIGESPFNLFREVDLF